MPTPISRRRFSTLAAAGGIAALAIERPRGALAQSGCFAPLPAVEGRALLIDVVTAWATAHAMTTHAAALGLIDADDPLTAIDAGFVTVTTLANAAAESPLVTASEFLATPATAAVSALADMETAYNTLVPALDGDASDAIAGFVGACSAVARNLQTLSYHIEDLLPGEAWAGFAMPSTLKAHAEICRAATSTMLSVQVDDHTLEVRQAKSSIHAAYFWLDAYLAQGFAPDQDDAMEALEETWDLVDEWVTAHGAASGSAFDIADKGEVGPEFWTRYYATTLDTLVAIGNFAAGLDAMAAV